MSVAYRNYRNFEPDNPALTADDGEDCPANSGSFTTEENISYERGDADDIIHLFAKALPPVLASTANQIEFLRRNIGLNIAEIAQILSVKRPTIYEWMEGKEPSKRNQNRLNEIYKVCSPWEKTKLGRMQSYLHKIIIGNDSLFTLLSAKKLRSDLIIRALHAIEIAMLAKQKKQQEYEQFLQQHGFRKPTTDEIRRAIKDMTFSIG